MKALNKIKFFLFAFIFLFVSGLNAQDFSKIGSALQSGNTSELGKYFDGNVELTILNTEAVYSKSQAEMVIKNFFSSNSPKSYKVVHNGDSGSGAKYQIGELTTSGGVYRTYVYAKEKMGSMLIQEIRIEKN
ncbi:MAG: DUF4783 domain-containing protein [Chitinophagales bacterium]|nr:DUF4783 domain-containing protein [Chitinophagales bacterium]